MWPYWWPLEGQRIRRHHVSLLGKSCHLKCMALLLVRAAWIVITPSFSSTWLFQRVVRIQLWPTSISNTLFRVGNSLFSNFLHKVRAQKEQKSDGILFCVKKSCFAQNRHFWSQTRHLWIFLKLDQMKVIKKWVKVIYIEFFLCRKLS